MVKCPKCNSAAVMCEFSPDYFTFGLREAFSCYNVSTHCYENSAASKDTIFAVELKALILFRNQVLHPVCMFQ